MVPTDPDPSIYLSIIIPARNSYELTQQCLISAKHTFEVFEDIEFILIDDNSDHESQIIPLFLDFRSALPDRAINITSFKERQHYTGVFTYGLTQARGHFIFFLSNDMMITPSFIETVLNVAELDESIGIVRGSSEYTDALPQYACQPPFPLRNYQDVIDFSSYVAQYHGYSYSVDTGLSGDAVLIKRKVIDQVGYMDTQFFGYFGDVDYGLRVRKAGLQLVCAPGAWLHHEAVGHVKYEAMIRGQDYQVLHAERMELVRAAYAKFRQKWDVSLPEYFPFKGVDDQLGTFSYLSDHPTTFDCYHPAPFFPPHILEIL